MKRALLTGLSLASALALMLGVSGIALAQEDTEPETEEPIYAAASLKQAAEDNAEDDLALNWEDYAWKAEYKTSNKANWEEMSLANAAQLSFSHNGTHGSQPCIQVKQKEGKETEPFKVNLNANQYATGNGWYSKAAVTFTATEAGQYILTCDTMEPGRLWSSSENSFVDSLNGENGDGHVTVYKNDTKIWPADKAYASVTSENHPVFDSMTVTLAVGDVIRFEGFGGAVGGEVADNNPNGYMNDIFINPAIAKVKETVSEGPGESTGSEAPGESTGSEAPGESGTVSPESTVSEAPKGTTVSARADLLKSLEAGDVLADCAWKPVFTNANSVDWNEMTAYDETFSFAGNWSLPYVWMPENGGVVLNANQWATGVAPLFWDKAGISYTSPKAQKVVLKAGDIKTISAGTETALSTVEGRVAIYKNGAKIWPKDKDFVSVKQGVSVDFPELELNLKKGDVIVIEGYGAKVGGEITDDVGGSWENQILMDPVIFIPDDQTGGDNPSTGVSSLPLFIGALLCVGAAGAVVSARKRRA